MNWAASSWNAEAITKCKINRSSKEGGGLNAIFDSQAENFLSQRVQSTRSTSTELVDYFDS